MAEFGDFIDFLSIYIIILCILYIVASLIASFSPQSMHNNTSSEVKITLHRPVDFNLPPGIPTLSLTLIGCSLLGVGVWLKIDKDDYVNISKYDYITAANLIIATGAIILVIGFFGCFGAIKEIPCLLLTFFILLLVIFILEVSAGSYAYIKRGDIEKDFSSEFREAIQNEYGTADNQGVTDAIDKFQESFDCCGFDSYKDWTNSTYKKIPKSCCIISNTNCGSNPEDYYQKGCFTEVKDFLEDNLLYIGASAIAFAVIQILGMSFSLYLYCAYRENQVGTV